MYTPTFCCWRNWNVLKLNSTVTSDCLLQNGWSRMWFKKRKRRRRIKINTKRLITMIEKKNGDAQYRHKIQTIETDWKSKYVGLNVTTYNTYHCVRNTNTPCTKTTVSHLLVICVYVYVYACVTPAILHCIGLSALVRSDRRLPLSVVTNHYCYRVMLASVMACGPVFGIRCSPSIINKYSRNMIGPYASTYHITW